MVKRPPRSNLLSIWLRAPRPPYSGRPSSQWLTPRFDRATGKAAPSMAPLLVGVPPALRGDPSPASLARTGPPAPLRRRPWRLRSPARGAPASYPKYRSGGPAPPFAVRRLISAEKRRRTGPAPSSIRLAGASKRHPCRSVPVRRLFRRWRRNASGGTGPPSLSRPSKTRPRNDSGCRRSARRPKRVA